MSLISFAILFGGEMTENWSLFWRFTVETHQSINRPDVTIISDQSMGCIAALVKHVPQAHRHFHCAWHQRQNIIKTCGGSAATSGNALWTYNLLAEFETAAALNHHSEQQMPGLYPTDHHYLTKLPNEVQCPPACCAMSDDVYMYGFSASSGSHCTSIIPPWDMVVNPSFGRRVHYRQLD